MTEENAEIVREAALARDHLFANLVTLVLGLAAETHPEQIQKALAKVYNFEAVEETTRRMMAVVTSCQQHASEARILLEEVNRQFDAMEFRVDQLNERIGKMENRINKAARTFKATLAPTKQPEKKP